MGAEGWGRSSKGGRVRRKRGRKEGSRRRAGGG